jgi:hypothetical protein
MLRPAKKQQTGSHPPVMPMAPNNPNRDGRSGMPALAENIGGEDMKNTTTRNKQATKEQVEKATTRPLSPRNAT